MILDRGSGSIVSPFFGVGRETDEKYTARVRREAKEQREHTVPDADAPAAVVSAAAKRARRQARNLGRV
jgi:hypothetical protein